MLNRLKAYMMPISMIIGVVFCKILSHLAFITPALIFLMLFISYCNIPIKNIKIKKLHIQLLIIQFIGCLIVYKLISFYNPIIAQGVMICILAPTATSAIVITGMLGGNTTSLATYSLLSNLSVVILAPFIFILTGYEGGVSFWHSAIIIFEKVFILLLLPFVLSIIFRKIFPIAHDIIKKRQSLSFYLWSLALMVVTAKTVMFIFDQEESNYITEIIIAISSFVVCVSQFLTGRKLGEKYGDKIAGGQGLGQKNTILAIWMAQTYLNPISSIGPGAYVLWQNIINSYQVWRNKKTISSG